MRIHELLSEARPGELELVPDAYPAKVVMYKGRRLVITGGRRISTRRADFSIGAWYFSMDGGAQLPCWVTGPNSAVCGLNS